MIPVPLQFQQEHPFHYPEDNVCIFEEWLFDRWNYEGFQPNKEADFNGREYLPVFWTGYFVRADFGKNQAKLQELQNWIDTLDHAKKYWTPVQYDDGILIDLSKLDIVVCAMSGNRIDFPLPLVCQPHNQHFDQPRRDIFMNFIGRNTHPIRERLFRRFPQIDTNIKTVYVTDRNHNLATYCHLLARSVFTLCPRGYGANSFRIAEALQFGSIPVYISDKFIEPYNIDFNEIGLKIDPDQIDHLEEILYEYQLNGRITSNSAVRNYHRYYTYEMVKRNIQLYLQSLLS